MISPARLTTVLQLGIHVPFTLNVEVQLQKMLLNTCLNMKDAIIAGYHKLDNWTDTQQQLNVFITTAIKREENQYLDNG